MIFNMVGKGGSGGSLLISDTLDVNGGIIRTITATKVVKLQTKAITPTSSAQTVNPDTGYDGFSQVTVEASSGGITPTGNIDITSDGVIDVTNYATATVPSASFYPVISDLGYSTVNNIRQWKIQAFTELYTSEGDIEGWISEGNYGGQTTTYHAVASGTTVTPTESPQTIGGVNYMMEGAVTVNAIPSNYVGSGITSRSSSDLTASGATVTVPAGYYSAQATKSVSNGSATGPSSLSGTGATVSTGTNTLTLTKTGVTTTPTVSAGYVSSATSSTATVTLTASVTTKAADTYHPSTTAQSIAASTYLTGTQTINAVTTTNLTAANIKKDVVVKIGDSSDDDCVVSITGTYEGSGGGGGSGLTVATTTATLSSASTSISFTGLAGEPTSFAVISASELATGASPWKTASVVYDGTDTIGQTIRNTSNAQVSYDGTGFSHSYSNGTLTIIGTSTNFQANQYKLVYTYGGSTSDIGTSDVQVGSGATTITFTGLEEEPSYFSCIFKSNFSTSSGYQRVITVIYDGTSIYGMEMDSSAKASTAHWSYTYNNGSLTISSQGTNAGGYFHQPGYYQLTYATEGEGDNYQSKTVTPTTSEQTITADSGYLALKKVVVNAIPNTYVQPTATKGATTYTPGTTNQTIASGTYLTGIQTISGDANLVGTNIISGISIFGVPGQVVLQNVYTGSSAPSSSTGANGDIYIQS